MVSEKREDEGRSRMYPIKLWLEEDDPNGRIAAVRSTERS